MFIFSTNTIINSLNWPGFKQVNAEEHTDLDSKKRFWVDETTNPDTKILRIARDFRFDKANVVAVYKRAWEAPELFKVTFDLSKLIAARPTNKEIVGRVELYVRLSGSNNSYYANDSVYKGKPFYVEFPVKMADTDATLAKSIVKIAKKYQNMVYEYPLINVYTSNAQGVADPAGTCVTFEGTDEYQLITKAELQYYNESARTFDCCASFGEFNTLADGVVVVQGEQSFGTYRQIMKDLRLPTAANTRWDRIAIDETPIPGAHYNQYIIYQCVNRGIMGSDAVGDLVKSRTHHVFYVLDNGGEAATNPAKAFEEALAKVIDDDAIKEVVDKDYDDVALTKEDIEKSYGVSGAEGTAGSVKNIANKAHGANVENQKVDPKTAPRGLDTAEGIETNHKQ